MGNILDALKDIEKMAQSNTKTIEKTKKLLKDSENKVKERENTVELLKKMK